MSERRHVAAEVAGTSYSDKTVVNGTVYYYVVEAVNPGGASTQPPDIVATPHVPTTIQKANNTTGITGCECKSGAQEVGINQWHSCPRLCSRLSHRGTTAQSPVQQWQQFPPARLWHQEMHAPIDSL